MTPALQGVVDQFAVDHPECANGDFVTDRCITYSDLFIERCRHLGARQVSGFRMTEDNIILNGHTGALVEGLVIDWTARQFDPGAPVPQVMPLDQWQQQWVPLGAHRRVEN